MPTHEADIDGHLVFWREAPGDGGAPVLWLHGVPDHSEIWADLLSAAGGVAPDLPGFGRSGKRADFDYSIDGYATWLERFCDHLGLDRVRLVVHDWGAVGLAFAQRHPQRVERLVAVDAVPFVAGYRWHRLARIWRTPLLGEVAMGLISARTARLVAPEVPPGFADRSLPHLDHGTQRAILRLYRAGDPDVLAAAGENLAAITAPGLVLWGERDRYIATEHGRALAAALPGAELEILSGLGHWPWLEDRAAAERILSFLRG